MNTDRTDQWEHRNWHVPVMADKITQLLIRPSTHIVVDCTVGTGGHSLAILEAAGKQTILVGIDMDENALAIARERLKPLGRRVILKRGNYGKITELLKDYLGRVDSLLIDCGISRLQITNSDRGFSFDHEGPLDMRFDNAASMTAEKLLKGISFEELRSLLSHFGEPRASSIAKAILERRDSGKLSTTLDLAGAVKAVVKRKQAKSLARVFLAIRACVNNELENLKSALESLKNVLGKGGRACVITYHSAEDTIVKQAFRKYSGKCICPPGSITCRCGRIGIFRQLTRKPLVPSADEIRGNPSARSAKIRVVEKM